MESVFKSFFMFIDYKIFLTCIILFSTSVHAQQYKAERTTAGKRAEFRSHLVQNIINKNLHQPLNASAEQAYQSAFWGMELSLYRSALTDSAVLAALSNYKHNSPAFNRALLQVIYTLYPSDFAEPLKELLKSETDPKLFAMISAYLLRTEKDTAAVNKYLTEKFTDVQHPILTMLKNYLNPPPPLPSLLALLNHDFGGKAVFFSFQRNNRDYEGITILKKPDGSFLTGPGGKLTGIPQLARSITDMPGYLTNGNTPMGILSVQGTGFSDNVFIGPSPLLDLKLPYESSVSTFFHGTVPDTVWSLHKYLSILPPGWRHYKPLWEAYYAGEAGRTEIAAHGTTINPEFYKGKPYYPNTPSLGCLTAAETWSPEDGAQLSSSQMRLIEAYKSAGSPPAYFIVIDIDDKQAPVSVNEIQHLIK